MADQPSNHELATKIDAVDKKVDRRFNAMNTKISTFKKEVDAKIDPIHDFFVGVQAVEKSKRNTNAQLINNFVKIVLILVAIIAFLLNIDIKAVLGA